jgi:hypothetical protein
VGALAPAGLNVPAGSIVGALDPAGGVEIFDVKN